MEQKLKVAVVGAGNMGTAVAHIVAQNGHSVQLWNHKGDLLPLRQIAKSGVNKKYLPDIELHSNVIPQPSMQKALEKAVVVFIALPSFCIEQVIIEISKYIEPKTICVDLSKGICPDSLLLVPEVIRASVPASCKKFVSTVSGPTIAKDLATGVLSALLVASKSSYAISMIKQVLQNKTVKLYETNDITGVELCGAFKNVYAVALGICDGMNMEMNTKSIIVTNALQEMKIIVKKMGGKIDAVYGLAGVGDLIGTGFCIKSRNRRFGQYLAEGMSPDFAFKKIKQVVEGVAAATILSKLAKKHSLHLPLGELVNKVSTKKASANKEMKKYLSNI